MCPNGKIRKDTPPPGGYPPATRYTGRQKRLGPQDNEVELNNVETVNPVGVGGTNAAGGDDAMSKLQNLAEMYEKGYLSESEFKAAKANLFGKPADDAKPGGHGPRPDHSSSEFELDDADPSGSTRHLSSRPSL